MKFRFIAFLLIFSLHLSYSQKKKYYLDENNRQITKGEFKNFDIGNYKYLKLSYENDTAKVRKIEKRELKGKLDKEKYHQIIKFLAKKDSKTVDSTKTIIINYHPGKDECNTTGNSEYVINLYRNFLADIKLIRNVNQYFFYKSQSGLEFFKGNFDWLADDERIFEKSFFPIQYPCGSYLIIYPNRDYYVYKGEYYILEILQKVK